jgi:hypothetical protein
MNTALTTNGTMTMNIPFTHAYIWSMTLYLAELNPNASASSREFYVGIPGYSPTWLVNPLVDGGSLGAGVNQQPPVHQFRMRPGMNQKHILFPSPGIF